MTSTTGPSQPARPLSPAGGDAHRTASRGRRADRSHVRAGGDWTIESNAALASRDSPMADHGVPRLRLDRLRRPCVSDHPFEARRSSGPAISNGGSAVTIRPCSYRNRDPCRFGSTARASNMNRLRMRTFLLNWFLHLPIPFRRIRRGQVANAVSCAISATVGSNRIANLVCSSASLTSLIDSLHAGTCVVQYLAGTSNYVLQLVRTI